MDDKLNTIDGAINVIYMTLQGSWEGWSNAYQVEAEEAHWLEIVRLARLGAAVEAMAPLQCLSKRGSDDNWELDDEMRGVFIGSTPQVALEKAKT